MTWLLDTPVVSELVRATPKASVIDWLRSQDENDLFLSVLTLGELEKGIAKLSDSRRKSTLRKWVRTQLMMRFEDRLLAVDRQVASRWGMLTGTSERKGRPLPVVDSLIAATAIAHELTVVSRNATDFERCGVPCLNPWSD
jgi:predicted nucleic acid-binding protein